VAIVIVVIPIAVGMPTVAVFVPPAVPLIPAAFPRLVQFVPGMIGLSAVPAMVLHGFMQSVIRLGDAALAAGILIRACTRRAGESKEANKRRRCEHCLSGKLAKQNIILIYGRKYWDEVLNWKAMVRWGMINEDEYKMLQFADTVDEAFEHIRAGLEKYHMDADPFLQAY